MNVTQRMQIGASLMLLAKFLERGLGLISTVILARLLLPGDFGLVAMAAPIVKAQWWEAWRGSPTPQGDHVNEGIYWFPCPPAGSNERTQYNIIFR